MIVVRPTQVASTMLASTTAVEAYAAWAAATNYSVGAKVLRTSTQRIYQRLIAGTTATVPELDNTNWSDYSPSNKWAMFDQQTSTLTVATTSLEVTVASGSMDTVMLLGLDAYSVTLTVRDGLGGTIGYTNTVSVASNNPANWYDYFFQDLLNPAPSTQTLFRDLPPYPNSHITILLTGGSGETITIGNMLFGLRQELGSTQYGAKAGIIDYSSKDTDIYGTTTFVVRAFSKRLTADLLLDNAQLNRVQRLFYNLRAIPCIWIGHDDAAFSEALIVYGFYRDFSTTIAYPYHSLCSLEIEGLI
jgi:hypothetical protein